MLRVDHVFRDSLSYLCKWFICYLIATCNFLFLGCTFFGRFVVFNIIFSNPSRRTSSLHFINIDAFILSHGSGHWSCQCFAGCFLFLLRFLIRPFIAGSQYGTFACSFHCANNSCSFLFFYVLALICFRRKLIFNFFFSLFLSFFAMYTFNFYFNQWFSNDSYFANFTKQSYNGSISWRRNVCHNFIGFHLHQIVSSFHFLAFFHIPFKNGTFFKTLTYIGKIKYISHLI